MPGEYYAQDAQCEGHGDVDAAGHGFAVEGCVLGGHDAGCDEERYTGVVYAGEAFEERLVGDAVHGVPDRAADEALGRGEEEHEGDKYVGFRAGAEVRGRGVEVECDGQDEDEAEEVRPDVYCLVGEGEGRFEAGYLAVAEAVAAEDERVDLPRGRQVFVADEAVFSGAGYGLFDAFAHSACSLHAFVKGFAPSFHALVYAPPAFVNDARDSSLFDGVGACFEV